MFEFYEKIFNLFKLISSDPTTIYVLFVKCCIVQRDISERTKRKAKK